MRKLKSLFQSERWIGLALAVSWLSLPVQAASTFELAKHLVGGAGGVLLNGGPFTMSFSWGEAAASQMMSFSTTSVDSGYYGGRFGAGQSFNVLGINVGGSPAYFQNGLQIGVTVQATVEFRFSDQLDPGSITRGLKGTVLQDHLARAQRQPVALTWEYDPVNSVLKVKPESAWLGNTVHEIAVVPGLVSISGYALSASTATRFLTMADPHQENVIVNALLESPEASLGLNAASSGPPFQLHLPPESLSDYSVVLFNSSGARTPPNLDSAVVDEANRKARVTGGAYQTPLGFIEIVAYNAQGQRLQRLSQPGQMTMSYGGGSEWASGAPAPVHVSSLALWTLDTQHRLWVKIPASLSIGQTVSAPITQLAVFALMGSALGQARDVFVFPTPWRPFGPNAGDGPGQTGTESGGITFSTLPSECRITIYTLDGHRVRELRHSDAAGPVAQETWDGRTADGSPAASGVYLWRVESEQDGKNGKLMIIR